MSISVVDQVFVSIIRCDPWFVHPSYRHLVSVPPIFLLSCVLFFLFFPCSNFRLCGTTRPLGPTVLSWSPTPTPPLTGRISFLEAKQGRLGYLDGGPSSKLGLVVHGLGIYTRPPEQVCTVDVY